MLRQLNCFSNKKKRKRGKKLADDANANHHQLLLKSPSGSSSTSATRRIGSPDTANTSISLSRLSSQQSNRDPRNDDNSIPTLDSDYNNIQACTFSVSDAGGTLGSGGTNNKSLSNFSQAASALGFGLSPSVSGPSSSLTGNNNNNQQHPYHQHLIQSPYTTQREEYIEIYAPAGKLGVVIDTPMSSSTPIVHAIKDTCPIKNEIYVGDKLVAVDDVDVREYQAVDVSMLIGNKSSQERRKLTIIRTARGRDGMY